MSPELKKNPFELNRKTAPPAAPDAVEPTSEAAPGLLVLGRDRITVEGCEIAVATMGRFGYEAGDPPISLTVQVRASATAGQWCADLLWTPPPSASGLISLFRVTAYDGEPGDFEASSVAHTLTLTTACEVSDDTAVNAPAAVMRHYTVWRYQGADPVAAARRPPTRYAMGTVVWPPLNLTGDVRNGQVVVTWDVPDPTDQKVRYLWARQTRQQAITQAPTNQVQAVGTGFVDSDVDPGHEFVYTVSCVTSLEGEEHRCDVPARFTARVDAVMAAVMDLEVVPTGPGSVELRWHATPGATVEIYSASKSPTAPVHEIGEVAAEQLASADYNMRPRDRLNHPITSMGDGSFSMVNVALADRAETYFTPVTRLGNRALPGKTVSWLRPLAPGDPEAVDRVAAVLIIFRWPEGASKVKLFVTGNEGQFDPAATSPLLELTEEEHRSLGAFRIDRSRLPDGASRIALCGYRMHGGDEAYSEPVMLDLSLPAHLHYQVKLSGMFKRKVQITLQTDSQLPGPVALRLVASDSGFPLSLGDGVILWDLGPVTIPPGPQGVVVESEVAPPKTGVLRLMADPRANVAVIDPPLSQLQLER